MARPHKAFEYWFKFLTKGKYFIILFWLIVLGFAVKIGPKFLQHTQASMNPPPGSPANIADTNFANWFPNQSSTHKLIVFITWNGNPNETIMEADDDYLDYILNSLQSQLLNNADWGTAAGYISQVVGYYTYPPGSNYSTLNGKFICCAPDFQYSIIQIVYVPPSGTALGSMISYLRSTLSTMQDNTTNWTLGLTGQDALYQDIVNGTASDMERMDIIVLPLALLTLAYVVKSYRLMIIPILSVATSLFTSYMLMLPISINVYNVASVCPSVMMSLTIAMSIDYSLFLLTRYREEHQRKRDDLTKHKKNEMAVKNMEYFAGHIVSISGSTLAVTFVALAFFPMDFLKSVGVGAALALVCTMSVNLTLTPAILLAAGGFFSYFDTPWLVRVLCPCWLRVGAGTLQNTPDGYPIAEGSQNSQVGNSTGTGVKMDKIEPLLPGDVIVHSQHTDEEYAKVRKQLNSRWYKTGLFSTTRNYAIGLIIGILIIAIPFLYELSKMTTTIDTNCLIPRNSPALSVYNDFEDVFPAGEIKPYDIMMQTQLPTGIMSPWFWNYSANFTSYLNATCWGVDTSMTQTIATLPYINAQTCLFYAPGPWPESIVDICAPYYLLWTTVVMPSGNANPPTITYVQIVTSFDPTGDDSPPFISCARGVLSDFQTWYPNISLYMTGGAVDSYDAVAEVHKLFPSMIGGTCAAVFIIIGALFRSIFVPIRLLLTIAMPITWVYGLSVIVFEESWWIDNVWTALQQYNSIYWLIPVMCFSILVGLGLDYDIFLFSRVVEYRRLGYNDRAAIVKGLYRTGGIITAAGVIMFIAFAGLMLSEEMVLNQYGFMLSFAVLADTFVVRTLIVPAIMSLAGPVNWWPGAMPPATKDLLCQDEEEETLSDDEEQEGEYDQAFENEASKNLLTQGSHQAMTTPSSAEGLTEE